MPQRSFKLPDGLDARLVAVAAAEGRSVSNVIVRALERALGSQQGGKGREAEEPDVVKRATSAPARASEPVEGAPPPKIAPRHWAR